MKFEAKEWGSLIGPDVEPPGVELAKAIVELAIKDYCDCLHAFLRAMDHGVKAECATRKMFRDCESFFLATDTDKVINKLPMAMRHRDIINLLRGRVFFEYFVETGVVPDIEAAINNSTPYGPLHKPRKPYSLRRFTVDQVKEIRKKLCNGSTYSELAEEYGVDRTSIFQMCNGVTYKDIPLWEDK